MRSTPDLRGFAATHCAYSRSDGQAELVSVAGNLSLRTSSVPAATELQRTVTSMIETATPNRRRYMLYDHGNSHRLHDSALHRKDIKMFSVPSSPMVILIFTRATLCCIAQLLLSSRVCPSHAGIVSKRIKDIIKLFSRPCSPATMVF